jgi:hypothetical protein
LQHLRETQRRTLHRNFGSGWDRGSLILNIGSTYANLEGLLWMLSHPVPLLPVVTTHSAVLWRRSANFLSPCLSQQAAPAAAARQTKRALWFRNSQLIIHFCFM